MRPPLIVGVGGTTRAGSGTERVLRASLDAAGALGAQTRLLAGADLNLPLYAPGSRGSRARALTQTLARADGVIIASPAYHGTLSGLVKNALDHVEDLREADRPYLEGRAVGCIAVAGGPQAGATTLSGLRTVVHALRGWPTPLGIAVDTSGHVFDEAGAVADAAVLARLALLAEQVVGFALDQRSHYAGLKDGRARQATGGRAGRARWAAEGARALGAAAALRQLPQSRPARRLGPDRDRREGAGVAAREGAARRA